MESQPVTIRPEEDLWGADPAVRNVASDVAHASPSATEVHIRKKHKGFRTLYTMISPTCRSVLSVLHEAGLVGSHPNRVRDSYLEQID